jgi:flagellar protein FliS
MNLANPWKSYRQVATQTASPGQLVLMLYDGALRFLERSLTGFSIEDPAESNQAINNNVIRAQEIINELNYSLNMDKGGEIAVQLRSLYVYFDRRLMESNIHKSPEGIKEVIARLTTLRDAWSTMLSNRDDSQSEAPGRLPQLAMA